MKTQGTQKSTTKAPPVARAGKGGPEVLENTVPVLEGAVSGPWTPLNKRPADQSSGSSVDAAPAVAKAANSPTECPAAEEGEQPDSRRARA